MHRMPYLDRSFSAKKPYNWWLFCRKRPATKGIACIFATLYNTNADSAQLLANVIHSISHMVRDSDMSHTPSHANAVTVHVSYGS